MKTQLTFTRDELAEAFREWNKSMEDNPDNFVPLSEAVPEAQADHLIKLLNNLQPKTIKQY